MSVYRAWSNTAVPEADQFSHWAETICEIFGPMTVEREADGPFPMEVTQAVLGPLSLSAVEASAHRSFRTLSTARAAGTGTVYISVPRVGRLVGHQSAQELAPAEGWLGMLCGDEAADVVATSEFRQLVIGLPRELVGPRLTRSSGIAFGVLAGLLAQMAEYLFAHADDLVADEVIYALGQVADLVVACFGSSTLGPVIGSELRLQAAMDEAERRLGDPTLGTDSLARHVNVSRRTVEELFAEQGTTVGRWVLARRLERARADLELLALDDLTIETIAQRWGFADRTHFSRVFRDRFDVAPGEYRRAMRSSDSAD